MSQPEPFTGSAHPAAIIWDLDGTLVESAPDLATALGTLLNEQGQHGHPVEKVRTMIGDGVAKLIERGFRAAGAPLDAVAIDALVPRFMEIYTACATQSTHLVPERARRARTFLPCRGEAGIVHQQTRFSDPVNPGSTRYLGVLRQRHRRRFHPEEEASSPAPADLPRRTGYPPGGRHHDRRLSCGCRRSQGCKRARDTGSGRIYRSTRGHSRCGLRGRAARGHTFQYSTVPAAAPKRLSFDIVGL